MALLRSSDPLVWIDCEVQDAVIGVSLSARTLLILIRR